MPLHYNFLQNLLRHVFIKTLAVYIESPQAIRHAKRSRVECQVLTHFARTLAAASVFAVVTFPICSLLASVAFFASSILALALLLLVSIVTFVLAPLTVAFITITRGCDWIRRDKHTKTEYECHTNS